MKKTRLNLPALILLAGLTFVGCKDGTTVDNAGPVNTCDGDCVLAVWNQKVELGLECSRLYKPYLYTTELMAAGLGAHDDALWASWRKRNGFTHDDPAKWKYSTWVEYSYGKKVTEYPCTNDADLKAGKAAFYKKATEITGIKSN